MPSDKYLKNLRNLQAKLIRSGLLEFAKALPPSAELYLVGGAVRDCLLGLADSGDYDFVIRNINAKDLEKILAKYGRVNLVGKHFGVFKFTPKKSINNQQSTINNQSIDIALPRTEHSLGTGAYRDFKIKSDPKLKIEDDLSRRDFTINAIAWRINNHEIVKSLSHEIIDPFHGLNDLQSKLVRTVNNPAHRFREDYSRLLRAIRFSCQLDFKIEKNTWLAVKKIMPHINATLPSCYRRGYEGRSPSCSRGGREGGSRITPYEVISAELLKALSYNPAKALELLDESGALKNLIPELLPMKGCPQPKNWHSEGDVWVHTKLALKLLSNPRFNREFSPLTSKTFDPEIVLAVLFHDIAKPVVIKIIKKNGKEKIQFHGHEKISAKLAQKICNRLRFQAVPNFKIDCRRLTAVIGKHLLCVNAKIDSIKNTTIEKYFIHDPYLGKNFLKLFWLDAQASVPAKGKPNLVQYRKLRQRIKELEGLKKKNNSNRGQIKTLINGHDIMKKFNLEPGQKIGELLEAVREAQLSGLIKTKKSALAFLKNEVKT